MDRQRTANIGLYYVCYKLARLGWNVLPTSRNSRGIDLLAYSEDGTRRVTVQVKALSSRSYVPLGSIRKSAIPADFWIICRGVQTETPECFVLTDHEVSNLAEEGHGKDGSLSYWVAPRSYERPEFRERWERIGSGLGMVVPATPTLDDLLAGVTDDSLHGEHDFGPAVGREVW